MNSILNDKNVLSLINKDENYIIFNDGVAIRQNIQENEIEIEIADNYDIYELCKHNRTAKEEDIVNNSRFTTVVNIYKSGTLKIIRFNDKQQYSNLVFNIKKDVEIDIVNIYYDVTTNTNALVDVICSKRSNVKYTSVQTVKQEFSEYVNFYVDEKVNLDINSLGLNENKVSNCTNVYMYKPLSYVTVNNSIINSTSLTQQYDYNVYHWYNDTTSNLINYAICKDSSELNINSNGIIKKGCAKSKLSQKSKGIILDLTSAISANPLLQIDEFDVEANHGASIGAIDDEDLYYLMSRGLTKTQSEQLIVTGYMNPIISKINDELIKNYIAHLIEKKL